MSTITGVSRTNRWKPALALALALAAVAFVSNPVGPLGGFWRPAPVMPVPTSLVPGLLMLFLFVVESLVFGLGVAFLAFGLPLVRAISPASLKLTRLAHLAISWFLINWWFHDSLHLHVGMDLSGLLGIEYGFHFTLIVAACILAAFFLTLLSRGEELPRSGRLAPEPRHETSSAQTGSFPG